MRYVSYFRVSTDHQGINGLGMDAQQEAVRRFLVSSPGEVVGEYREVETGKRRDRPELARALDQCRQDGAILLIAKLDRLARNAAFVLGLRDSGVEFVCCDYPGANRLTIGVLAVVAEHEAAMISQRTRDGLAAAKRRGTRLGNPRPAAALELARAARSKMALQDVARVSPVIQELREAKVTTAHGLAKCLNVRGIRTVTGKPFKAQTVINLLARSDCLSPEFSKCNLPTKA